MLTVAALERLAESCRCFVLVALCALFAVGDIHGAKRAVEWTEFARHEAYAGRHDAALAAVDSALALDPQDYDARILKSRLLAWQTRFDDADSLLAVLEREYPGNTDVMLATATLRYYQGRNGEAIAGFQAVLGVDPAHADALEGLRQAERALEADARAAPPRWRVDAGGDYSTFRRRAVSDWNQQFAQISHRVLTSSHDQVLFTTYAKVERNERYGIVDWSFEAAALRDFSSRLRAALVGGWTPDAVFRPRWKVEAEGEWMGYAHDGIAQAALWLLAGARYDVYDDASFIGLTPGARVMWGSGWAATGRLFRVREHGAGETTGWTLRADGVAPPPPLGPVRENIRFWFGVADVPETQVVEGVTETVATRTLFTGVGLDLKNAWGVMLGYSRDDRENSWVRHAVNVGVAHAF